MFNLENEDWQVNRDNPTEVLFDEAGMDGCDVYFSGPIEDAERRAKAIAALPRLLKHVRHALLTPGFVKSRLELEALLAEINERHGPVQLWSNARSLEDE